MVLIPFPWNTYSHGIQNLFINHPYKCRIDKLATRKNNHLINYLRRLKKCMLYNQCSRESLVENYQKKSSILCNLREIICQRIRGKAFFEESIFVEAAIDMRKMYMSSLHSHIRWYLQALGISSRPTSSPHIVKEHAMFFIPGIWI